MPWFLSREDRPSHTRGDLKSEGGNPFSFGYHGFRRWNNLDVMVGIPF